MRTAALLLTATPLLVPGAVHAKTDTQLWLGATATGRIAEPLEGSFELSRRIGDTANGLAQQRVVAMLGYRIAPSVVASGGYVYAPDYDDGRRTTTEQRVREQVAATLGRAFGGTLSGYLRAEQRWRDTAPGTGWRVRAQLRWTHPLTRALALVLWHESFANLNDTAWRQRAGYDRMRNFIGLSAPLVPHVKVEGGYLNQHFFVPRAPDESDHVASLALGFTF